MKNSFYVFKLYYSLTKPRIVYLVIFTSLCGISLVDSFNIAQIFIILCSIALGAGGSACINMWYDQDIDKLMIRTRNRPLVKGLIKSSRALFLGMFLSFVSFGLMYCYSNMLATILMFIAVVYYAVIYTMILKRYSIYNVVFGAIPGSMPPVIGFSAISGYLSTDSIILFCIIFFWSPFHSWALVIFRNKDYSRSQVPMLPLVKGFRHSIIQIVFYSFLTIVCSYLPCIFGFAGIIYLILASVLNILLIYQLYILSFDEKKYTQNAKNLFAFSTIYLFLLFFIIFIHNFFKF